MKSFISFALLLSVSFLSAGTAGERIAVPLRWERNRTAASCQFEKIGAAEDSGNYVFAFTVAGLPELTAEKGSISVYWNCDGDKMTGRFGKSFGADIQFNIRLSDQSVNAILWENEKECSALSLPRENLHLAVNGNTVLMALRAEALRKLRIADRSMLRVNAADSRKRRDSIDLEVDFRKRGEPVMATFECNSPVRDASAAVSAPPPGKGIPVPVCWRRTENVRPGQFRAIGFAQDKSKYIFGFAGRKQTGGSILIYWNSDGDRMTGRFPGVLGVDIQFNVNPAERTVLATIWKDDKERRQMTLYEDDFLIEETGGVLFFVLRAEALKQVRVAAESSARVNHTVGTERKDSVEFTLGSGSRTELFLPERLNFIRFGSERNIRRKSAVAVPLRGTPPGVSVWSCGSERFQEQEATPEFSAPVTAFSMKAAAGETEHLFFAVETGQPFSRLELTAGPLKSSSGAVIGTEHQKIRYADFVEDDRGECYTDVLLPAFPGRAVKRQFTVFTCRVPRNAKPGVYTGELRLTINGNPAGTVPVQLEVYGFQLPEKPLLSTAFSVKQSHIRARFSDSETARRVYEKMLDQCARLRYGPRLLGVEPRFSLSGGQLQIDWSGHEKALEDYFQRFSVTQITPAQLGSHDVFFRWNSLLHKNYKDTGDPEFQSVWTQFVRQFYSRFRQNGYLNKILFIIWDEPYSCWNDIIRAVQVVRRNAPDLPVGIFIDKYEPLLENYIDIWLVPFSGLAGMRTDPKLAEKRVWLYNSGGVRNFRLPAADLRGFYLLAYRYKIEGFLSSEINMIAQSGCENGRFFNRYPQHCWMYVSGDGREVCDSWRQLLLSDGIDDFDYLSIYRNLLRKRGEREPEWLTAVLPVFRKDGSVDFKIRTIAGWNAVRDRIAREIVRMQSN